MIRVLLADDHEIVRNGIKQLLQGEPDIEVVGEASNGKESIQKIFELKPDILISDISMPEMDGIETIKQLQELSNDTQVIMLSMYDREEYVVKAVELGAFGYLLKDTGKDKFVKAIKTVFVGEKYFSSEISNIIVNRYLTSVNKTVDLPVDQKSDLTKREREILTLIVKGFNNKKIADDFNISVRTIETHRLNIMKKLKVNNAAELVRVTLEQKLVDL